MIRLVDISVEGYRSLYEVNLRFQPLTVIVGPNNSGKSNFVDALDFLAEVHRHGLELAIQRKGGFENIAHRRMRRTRRAVAFRVTALVPFDSRARQVRFARDSAVFRYAGTAKPTGREAFWIRIRHEFELVAEGQAIRADYSVSRESLTFQIAGSTASEPSQSSLFDDEAIDFLRIDRTLDAVTVSSSKPPQMSDREWDLLAGPLGDPEFAKRLERFGSSTELLLGRFPVIAAYDAMSEELAAMRIYQLAPLECRRAGVPTPNADLDRHGANLPALVDYMQKRHKEEWTRVEEAVQRIIPELEDIRVINTPDRRLSLQFVEKGVGRPWTSDEVSDGTIQSVALFAALNDPRASSIVIEEPENSVHPWILRVFVDACRQVEDKAIILTTHSPVLIDYVEPSEIKLIWRANGRSNLAGLESIDPQARDMWASGEISLFEILDSGYIRQAVPGESP